MTRLASVEMKNNKAVIYIHGKGGSADEAEHYKTMFSDREVIGFDYMSQTPWEAMVEFPDFFREISERYTSVILIANSIGAYFAMHALSGARIEKAYFISPIVNMEKLIADMMLWAGISEADLMEKGRIETAFGETLSWEYLSWVRSHPIFWRTPTDILFGSADNLQSPETIRAFAQSIGAEVTVMKNGEHWFHTKEQMAFLDDWIGKRVF